MRNLKPVPSRMAVILAIVAVFLAAPAVAGEGQIEGDWKTSQGNIATISKCGDSYCIHLKTGEFAGKVIGSMKGANSTYEGTITDPANDRTYTGKIEVSGSSLTMQGCAFMVFCQTQVWNRL